MKERYDFECCACGHSMQAAPSLSMHMGRNSGMGKCTECQTLLHLEITPDLNGEAMKSELWSQYANRIAIRTVRNAVN